MEIFKYKGADYFPNPIPLNVTRGYGSSRRSVPVHTHDFVELVFVTQGCTIHTVGGGADGKTVSYGLFPGDVFAVMPGEWHGYDNSQNIRYFNLIFDPALTAPEWPTLSRLSAWNALFGRSGEPRSKIHLPLHERRQAELVLQRIISELARKAENYELCARSALLEFLIITGRNRSCAHNITDKEQCGNLMRTIALLEQHPERPHRVEDLARIAGMSPSLYFLRFRQVTGLPPMGYLAALRLEKSCLLLLEKPNSVGEIALQCGFCDSNHFIKSFRERFGLTPARYRSQFRHLPYPGQDVGE